MREEDLTLGAHDATCRRRVIEMYASILYNLINQRYPNSFNYIRKKTDCRCSTKFPQLCSLSLALDRLLSVLRKTTSYGQKM